MSIRNENYNFVLLKNFQRWPKESDFMGLLWPPLYALLYANGWIEIFFLKSVCVTLKYDNFLLCISVSLYVIIIRKQALKFKSGQSNPDLRYIFVLVYLNIINNWQYCNSSVWQNCPCTLIFLISIPTVRSSKNFFKEITYYSTT